MARTRTVAATLLLAVSSVGLVATSTSPTVANPAFATIGAVVARAAAQPPLIQGVVVDQSGSFVDDVDVRAVAAGDVVASALTYASPRADGPQHGYFHLEVGDTGSYLLTLRKRGYVSHTYGPFEVTGARQRLAVGELTLARKPAATRTAARLADRSVTTRDRGKVSVTVVSGSTPRPAGTVEVRTGRKVVGSGVLRRSAKGKVAVSLHRLDAGSYHLTAYFLGTKTLKASSSKALTLTVTKPGRHHRVAPHIG